MRRATVRTTVDADDGATIAAALVPDNTDEMTTVEDEGTITTVIERPTTSGVRTTVDDYITNLTVAVQLLNNEPTNHE
ncbi:KEOPS complex subunit Pcc1 [Halocatena halophila]|uniref:KEOPS complex subunit Pcc1 n=1 Tax=Halocatena halophila TaxID=2814576 RepID=UPI002ED294CC